MAKVIPVRGVEGRHTLSGLVEVCFTALNGKKTTIAVMPSYTEKVCEVFQRLQGEPDTLSIETLPPASWKTLRAQVAGEPMENGGFRISADTANGILYLQIAQSDGTVAEIPLDENLAGSLLSRLGDALAAVRKPVGSI